MTSNITKIVEILKEIEENSLYGELLIKYESGKIYVVKKTESIKL